jgi:hypothetical protein
LVSAAVLGSLTLLGFGVDSLITRVIGMVPADSAAEFSRLPGRVQRFLTRCGAASPRTIGRQTGNSTHRAAGRRLAATLREE